MLRLRAAVGSGRLPIASSFPRLYHSRDVIAKSSEGSGASGMAPPDIQKLAKMAQIAMTNQEVRVRWNVSLTRALDALLCPSP